MLQIVDLETGPFRKNAAIFQEWGFKGSKEYFRKFIHSSSVTCPLFLILSILSDIDNFQTLLLAVCSAFYPSNHIKSSKSRALKAVSRNPY